MSKQRQGKYRVRDLACGPCPCLSMIHLELRIKKQAALPLCSSQRPGPCTLPLVVEGARRGATGRELASPRSPKVSGCAEKPAD
jgi:hypothetical protein